MRLEITCHNHVETTQKLLNVLVDFNITIGDIDILKHGKIFIDLPDLNDANFKVLKSKLQPLKTIVHIKTLPFLASHDERNNLKTSTINDAFSSIQAVSDVMKKVVREARQMSSLDSSILIMGETGTGKELLAKACHETSERAGQPFMTLNCAALPDDVAEFELFGVGEKNQETSKRGIFELADGGAVFLDEIGEMSTKLQSKLLRVIQNGNFRRVDSEQEVTVNVRFISSTNKDLLKLVSEGKFREDLYYRLNVLGLTIPPLRERRNDITPLADFFITHCGQRIGKFNLKLTSACRDFIENYPWPGNVRQLENVLTRATSLLEGKDIEVGHLQLPAYTQEQGYLEQEFEGTLEEAVKNYEARLLRNLFPTYPSSRQLAKKLGLSHTAIANKLREYNINKNTKKV